MVICFKRKIIWKSISILTLKWEQKVRAILRKISISKWITMYLERVWRMSQNRVEINLGDEEFSWKQSKTNFKKFSIFNDNCIASHMYKRKVKFYKPIYMYIGFSVLDLLKLWYMSFIMGDLRHMTQTYIYSIQVLTAILFSQRKIHIK